MINPWLHIPARDYEAHMASPEVDQTRVLKGIFASALAKYTPKSLAVIGCATGNGFEHIDTKQTDYVAAVDINPAYLAILKERFSGRIPGLKLIEADFTAIEHWNMPVSLVYAALVFEYVDIAAATRSIARCMAPGAVLVAALQLPSEESAPVTPTRYKSLELLTPLMRLISPDEFLTTCQSVGLKQIATETVPFQKGKTCFVGHYLKEM